MSLQVERLEKNMAKLTIEATAEEFDAAIQKAYLKNRSKMNVQGFRKGKAPMQLIEKMYGAGVFYEDAANIIIPDAYEKAADESDLDIVSRPEIDVIQIEKGKPFIFTAEVAVKPEVTLGDYKGIEVKKEAVTVAEEEVQTEIDRVRDQNSRLITITDRPVESGDQAVIDFEGFVNGTPFEGGEGKDYPLTIGSHSFIDTFEDQLIGKKIGEEVEVNVTFPEEYHVDDLKGKPAMFKVTVKELKAKELPELDDEFAQDVSEFDTLDEYRDSVRKNIQERKEKAAQTEKENFVVDKIIENAQMDIPDAMLDNQVSQMAEEFTQRIRSQGLTVEQYFQFTGMDAQKFMETLRPQAMKRIQSRLVLEKIAAVENIQISDEDFDKEIEEMAAMYKMEVDKMKEVLGDREKEQIKTDMAVQKAVDLVVETAVEA